MPGTPPFSPNLQIPRPSDGDFVSFSAQVNPIIDITDAMLFVPRVAALPTTGPTGAGALQDGQQVFLEADSANGVLWHLRYSTAKVGWEFVGGSPLYVDTGAAAVAYSNEPAGSVANVFVPVGPAMTIPRSGTYMTEFWALVDTDSVNTDDVEFWAEGSDDNPADPEDDPVYSANIPGGYKVTVSVSQRRTLAAASTLQMGFVGLEADQAGATVYSASLKATPVLID